MLLTDWRLNGEAAAVMAEAGELARRLQHEFIGPEHVMLALLDRGGEVVAGRLKRGSLDGAALRRELEQRIKAGPDPVAAGPLPMSPEGQAMLKQASRRLRQQRSPVSMVDLVDTLLTWGGTVGEALAAGKFRTR